MPRRGQRGSGALLGGQTYGWCVPMDRPMPECCMHAMRQKQKQSSRTPYVERRTFEFRTIAKLPRRVRTALAKQANKVKRRR